MPEPTEPLKVSVIATVLNEEESVADLIYSLANQTRPPDEVIIVDGGSSDKTVARIREAARDRLRLEVVELPGSNISEGRNAAAARATSEIIAATDAGVRLKPSWLQELIAPFERRRSDIDVVSGFFEPAPATNFEIAMGATVLPTREEINPARFLPSSRSVAFTKEAWRRAGGYPEWLDYCEDVMFDMALRKNGCVFAWAPEATVQFRPRQSLEAFFLQYYRYARGDGKAGLWPKRHAIRYGSYAAGLALLLSGRTRRWPVLLFGLGAALYLKTPYRRLATWLPDLDPLDRIEAIAWVPVIRVVGDVAKMLGYPAGLLWRLLQR